ncbi:MAG: beta-galactosidase, partial [Muribaculaceae bacterium]|nr:beta-galactosidase [Muribaculaceae bacterium]
MKKILFTLISFSLALSSFSSDITTKRVYLSGTGARDTRTWDFFCSEGMNSGKWSAIEVPSQWEQQGFGAYTYGRFYLNKNDKPSSETGTYRHSFEVPEEWKGKSVKIVFEGSMTDTDVKINGKSAGKTHQGGFTEFSFDISKLLKYGDKDNLLEVTVSKESTNKSVNAAERRADWWLFGGIYRPVYLEVMPKSHIDRIAVNAKSDGKLLTTMLTSGIKKGTSVDVELVSLTDGNSLGTKRVTLSGDSSTFITDWEGIRLWDCEHPNLYEAIYTLIDSKGYPLHAFKERIGFRDIDFREKDGLYLNGTKLLIKGVNRHCFHPETGRTLNREQSVTDAMLIKEMNMNAVRSHYPPDRHFLEVCDSIGLLYLDELPGWHDAYDSEVGLSLLKEFIARDVNHPSIIIWSNGNEGGWNRDLDGMFDKFDPQSRKVVHPWGDYNGIDTHHYPSYQTGPGKLGNGWKVFMPTEFLHSRYDKGAGSGLEDFWEMYRRNPMFAGGFIWAFVDEAIARTDRDGWLDSDGSNGCDGIVGPHREKEGSFYTIRDVWAPVQFAPFNITPSFDGTMMVTNEFLFTNFNDCNMEWRTYKVANPYEGGAKTLMASGNVVLPPIAPTETGRARFTLPDNFFDADILEIEMFDPHGRSVLSRTWPVKFASVYAEGYRRLPSESFGTHYKESEDIVTLVSPDVSVTFNRQSGLISEIEANGKKVPFGNGPIAVGMKAKVKDSSVRIEDDNAVLTVRYYGGIDSIVWRMHGNGQLSMDAVMLNREGGKIEGEPIYDEKITDIGITFSYPEAEIRGMTWLGAGPYRVWKNRQRGANFGLWHKDYNNTVTGNSFENLIYPEFKGYHGSLYWAILEGNSSDIIVSSATDGVFLRVFTPQEAEGVKGEDKMQPFPEGDISFLLDINAMRSFKPVSEHGPRSQPTKVRIKPGDEGICLSLR